MNEFSRKELEDFILAQPDERPVNFNDTRNRGLTCGCMMVQFGREVGLDFTYAGFYQYYLSEGSHQTEVVATIGKSFTYADYGVNHETYKTLKEAVLLRRGRLNPTAGIAVCLTASEK